MKELTFKLICACGYEIEGIFAADDYKEELRCECDYVWVIPRPYDAREDNDGR